MAEDYKPKEKAEGTFNGENIRFNREWSGHRFTDEEVEQLLAGDRIGFDCKFNSGDKYHVVGTLEHQEYNGHGYYGFKPDFDDDETAKIE